MKIATHVFFGMGAVWFVLAVRNVNLILALVTTFLITPFLSALPDRDQKYQTYPIVGKLVPHRGHFTHEYLIPLLPLVLVGWLVLMVQILPSIVLDLTIVVCLPVFLHILADNFNWMGVYVAGIRVKGFMAWDSEIGNALFRLLGLAGFLGGGIVYLTRIW